MKSVADNLHRSRLFASLDPATLAGLLEQSVQESGSAGSPVNARTADVVIVLEGGLEMRSREGRLLASLTANPAAGELGVLHAIPPGARLTLVRPSEVLIVEGSVLDAVLSQKHHADSVNSLEGSIGERVSVLIHTPPFDQMTLDQICRAAEAMVEVPVEAGQDVVRYAERGDRFYVIKKGAAEVWRMDVRNGQPVKVATLGEGASFGEEALLRGGLRNATVRMATSGVLFMLSLESFDQLLADQFVNEIDPEAAQSLLTRGQADLIDCRYDDEHDVWRIPGSKLIPLDRIREQAAELDRERQYLVYCRTGRRSRAAAFLLRQLGLKCTVIRGGIGLWPYAYEGEPVQQSPGIPPV